MPARNETCGAERSAARPEPASRHPRALPPRARPRPRPRRSARPPARRSPGCAACGSWCNPTFVDTHCKWCKCAACGWCHADGARSFPSGAGRWDCAAAPPRYVDAASGISTSSVLSASSVRPLVGSKWLVFVGDSSMRILFHLLLGVLSLRWERWPAALAASGHGPDPASTCLDRHDSASGPCLEDAYHKGVRLTAVWSDYGDEPAQLASLRALANQTLGAPDMLVLGVGAWWAWHRPSEVRQYGVALGRQLDEVDRYFGPRGAAYFRGLWAHDTLRVFAATTSCRRAGAGDASAAVVSRLNAVAKSHVLSRPGWVWHDREAVATGVCSAADCAGSQYTSRFHPGGDALNVLANMLLGRLHRANEVIPGQKQNRPTVLYTTR